MPFGMTFSALQSFKCKVDQQHKLGERQQQPQYPKPTMRIPFQANKVINILSMLTKLMPNVKLIMINIPRVAIIWPMVFYLIQENFYFVKAHIPEAIKKNKKGTYLRFTCNYILAAESFIFNHCITKKISKASCSGHCT